MKIFLDVLVGQHVRFREICINLCVNVTELSDNYVKSSQTSTVKVANDSRIYLRA